MQLLAPTPWPGTPIPGVQLTRLLLMCIGPARRLFCLLLFQPFYSDPKMKTLLPADWLSGGWKQALTNQHPPARPPASRSRFRPDLKTNKRVGGVGGSCGPCLGSAVLSWSRRQAGNPREIAPSPLRSPTRSPDPRLGPWVGVPALVGLPQLHGSQLDSRTLPSGPLGSLQLPCALRHHARML